MNQPLEQLSKPGFWDTARFRMKQFGGQRQPGMEDQPLNAWEKIGGLLQSYSRPDQESPYRTGMPKTGYSTPPFVEEYMGQHGLGSGLGDILGALRRFR